MKNKIKIISDLKLIEPQVKESIKKYGCDPEHNFFHYINDQPKGGEQAVFHFGNDKLVLASFVRFSNTWHLFPSGILSNESEKVDLILQFCHYCLHENSAKEVLIEIEDTLYQRLIKNLNNQKTPKIKICQISSIYHWPVVHLGLWDKELRGSEWRKLRKIKNRFYKDNIVKAVPAKEIPKKTLREIVFDWKSNRKCKDRAYHKEYLNLINNDFCGADYAMSMCINDVASSLACGWKVPNSNSFYLAVMLHNYKRDGLGEIMYLETLSDIKNMKFDSANLGGSDENLLSFKRKFRPHHLYKTLEFSITKN